MKKNMTKRVAWMLVFMMVIASSLPSIKVNAVDILDISGEDMILKNPTLVSGTALAQGAVYKYDNVLPDFEYSTEIDVFVTISGQDPDGYGSVRELDDDDYQQTIDGEIESYPERFQPIINSSDENGGYVTMTFEFKDNDGNPVLLDNFYLTAADIDGKNEGVGSEFYDINGYESYVVDETTGLIIQKTADDANIKAGYTRFLGISTSLDEITFEDTGAFIAYYKTPVSSITINFGFTGKQVSDAARLFSMSLGVPKGEFLNPEEPIPNSDKPTLSVEINDGDDNTLDHNDTITVVEISGTTNAGSGQEVTISVTDGVTILYGTAIVDSGTYTTTMDLSSLNEGNITAKANVINDNGNPADEAEDDSNIVYASVSTTTSGVYEVTLNDGSISNIQTITAVGGTFGSYDEETIKSMVTINGIPSGLDYTVERVSDTELTITYTGNATNHTNDDDVTNATVTISDDWISNSQGDVTTNEFEFDFFDPDSTSQDEDDDSNDSDNNSDDSTPEPQPVYIVVTYDKNGGDVESNPTSQSILKDESVGQLPTEPTREGYVFKGWNVELDGSGTGFYGSTIVSNDITVYAQWEEEKVTVIYNENGGTTEASPNNQTLNKGETVGQLPTEPIRGGYSFVQWNTETDGSGTVFTDVETIEADITVYAQWDKIEPLVKLDLPTEGVDITYVPHDNVNDIIITTIPERGTVIIDESNNLIYTPGEKFEEMDKIIVTVIYEDGTEEEVVIDIFEDEVDQGGMELPETGGVEVKIFAGLGGLFIALGLVFKKLR